MPAAPGRPISRFAWAYDDPTFSDVVLVLSASSGEGFAAQGGANQPASQEKQLGSGPRQHRSSPELLAAQDGERGDGGVRGMPAAAAQQTRSGSGAMAAHGTKVSRAAAATTVVWSRRVHAHSIILASCSEMMRCWLSRWSGQAGEEEERGRGHSEDGGGEGGTQQVRHRRLHRAHTAVWYRFAVPTAASSS
ncbi:hypothetical protein TSOC_011477 [Tetrabaena socialis]|uniref:Uncharacterized protein n=1 Tax=Tetrabaena socialis TaxID=47790 RepID=A0A2J7ZQJ2_9CHLO|nr:hypothetical protein TSOC_011477 [Tetrabaena socialis]|eukprot:PNH02538.1 hypothetical protein TSOC_011477 [Tetrabaena socialis]